MAIITNIVLVTGPTVDQVIAGGAGETTINQLTTPPLTPHDQLIIIGATSYLASGVAPAVNPLRIRRDPDNVEIRNINAPGPANLHSAHLIIARDLNPPLGATYRLTMAPNNTLTVNDLDCSLLIIDLEVTQ